MNRSSPPAVPGRAAGHGQPLVQNSNTVRVIRYTVVANTRPVTKNRVNIRLSKRRCMNHAATRKNLTTIMTMSAGTSTAPGMFNQ